jgi:acylphosphatase
MQRSAKFDPFEASAEASVDNDRKAVLARVTGRVQGVSFRVWTRHEARKLGLAGWVRNEDDGSVTALIVGRDAAVAAMIDRLRQGPTGASVANVASQQIEPDEQFSDFTIAM